MDTSKKDITSIGTTEIVKGEFVFLPFEKDENHDGSHEGAERRTEPRGRERRQPGPESGSRAVYQNEGKRSARRALRTASGGSDPPDPGERKKDDRREA